MSSSGHIRNKMRWSHLSKRSNTGLLADKESEDVTLMWPPCYKPKAPLAHIMYHIHQHYTKSAVLNRVTILQQTYMNFTKCLLDLNTYLRKRISENKKLFSIQPSNFMLCENAQAVVQLCQYYLIIMILKCIKTGHGPQSISDHSTIRHTYKSLPQ